MLVQGEYVARWVMQKVGSYTENMTALGWETDGKIIAAVAFENYNGNNMFGHQRIDSNPPRRFWFSIADYIFNHCKCKRLTATVEAGNTKAIELNKHIGFELEATLKDAGRNGDLLIMTLWRDKCRMLNWGKQ